MRDRRRCAGRIDGRIDQHGFAVILLQRADHSALALQPCQRLGQGSRPRGIGEAHALLAVPGVVGINISGLASGAGLAEAARIKAAIGTEVRGG